MKRGWRWGQHFRRCKLKVFYKRYHLSAHSTSAKVCKREPAAFHPQQHEMVRPSKDVSVGEYDPVSGLTHITHQRGRLLFNMGASSKKRQRRELQPPEAAAKAAPPPTSTGAFTGLSLYPEEANYLVQRGALVVYLLSSGGEDARELFVAEFTALLASDARVSLACMEVYTSLKDQKLHPRRCLESVEASSSGDGRNVPRHVVAGGSSDVAFDVWKTVTVDPERASTGLKSAVVDNKRQSQRKRRLALVFRVVVCRFGDAVPGPRSLRQAIAASHARGCHDGSVADSNAADLGCGASLTCAQIPVKLAVVHHDQSVLLFEISSSNPEVPN
ncbi:unnamed protein product [Phytophthora fragariaefolia]|uniref:Unnamed protein product n=1 Tax=Phytophthora fragariaefolia TaxID=1490495 RepID=A0A9W6XEX1_9STRA|nr:unnamed protein product [Phytophthora fragariaefolia]